MARPDFDRTCTSCLTYQYDEDTGLPKRWPDPVNGEYLKRVPGSLPNCKACPKCAWTKDKSPTAGRMAELSPRNRRTLEIYNRIKGSGVTPPNMDAITVRNLGIIHELEREIERSMAAATRSELVRLNTLLFGRGGR